MKPHVIAFYSYRGGVGRTTALCNVAARMAIAGDKVLVIDLDLQAPGASIILGGANYAAKEIYGIVDEIIAGGAENRTLDFTRCIRQMQLSGSKPFWLMSAGRLDSGYPGACDSAEITSLKPQQVMSILDALERCTSLENWHYVLIDCRPGLTKASLYAIERLAESVVVLFGLDRQSLHGVGWVREKFRDLNKLVHLVASRTPVRDEVRQNLDEASKAWEDPVQVKLSFDESMLLRERIVFSTEKSQLARDFDDLTAVVRYPDDIATLIADGRRLLGESGQGLAAHSRFQRAYTLDRKDVRTAAALAHYFTVTKTPDQALRFLEQAVNIDDKYPECWQIADALARESLSGELQIRLETIYQKAPATGKDSSLIAQLASFSQKIREASKGGDNFESEVMEAFAYATTAARKDPKIWAEFIRRIPLGENGADSRRLIVELLGACQLSAELTEAATQLKVLLEDWTKDITGMVTRFGADGYGFLASDDGQNDIYFRRTSCVSYGRDAFEFISVGESAVFDMHYGEDQRWQAKNVRFPSMESQLPEYEEVR